MTRYRPDIDGLRALAVAAVVLFHAGVPGVPGGFVGVDVFFVISGYLITANIHGDLLVGRFSIAEFYERRARRILPALFVMMLGVWVGASLFLPADLKLFAESTVAATLSLSNAFFWRHSGYFDVGASGSPLLHTWSLAVEEQFYIVFPLSLWLLARLVRGRRERLTLALAMLWALSFGFSLWQVSHDQRAAFYLPFDRAWELLTGALLAVAAPPAPERHWVREATGATALALIVAPAALLSAAAPFPGVNALAPCVGAVLFIWCGAGEQARPTLAARILQSPPLVGLGLVSYSLYLWHWPLLVFARYYSLGSSPPTMEALAVLAALLVAYASWALVERPFRQRAWLASRPALLAGCAASVLALCGLGGAAALAGGLPQRFTPAVQAMAAGADDHNGYRDHCFSLTPADLDAGRYCRIGVDNAAPTLAVWGDSHADALMSGFDALARAHAVAGVALTHGSCPPLLGVEVHEREDNGCPPLNTSALGVIERLNIRKVVLAARWAGYAEGRLYIDGAPPVGMRRSGAQALRVGDHAMFTAALADTFARLRNEGRQVFIVLPAPEAKRPVAETLALAAALHERVDLAPTRAAYDARQGFTRATIDRLSHQYGVVEIDPAARLCGPERCRVELQGRSLYYDADHLSRRGARFLEPLMSPVFAEAAASADAGKVRIASADGGLQTR